MKNDRFLDMVKKRHKKFHGTIRISIILLFAIPLLSGFLTQSLFVFGQDNNQTDSSDENDIIPYVPGDNAELNNQGDEPSVSENAPSNFLSDDDRSTNSQQNTDNGLTGSSGNSVVVLSNPDEDCLFDPSMPKCAPDENGNCPEGFGMNEDGQCFPRGGCPDGYHRVDDDESGRCIPNSDGCTQGMIFRPNMKSCGEKEYVCSQYPQLKECVTNNEGSDETRKAAFDSGYNHGCSDAKISVDSQRYINQPGKGPTYHTSDFMDGYYQGFDYCSTSVNNLSYDSGYNHGCNDAKIDDVIKRYISQVGKGPAFHTNEFMRGYYDGFDMCLDNNDSSNISKGIFKIIVEVTNHSPKDLTGEITVNVDHRPENILKSAYGLYFPGSGGIISKTFTFKSSDVPIGTYFKVNLEYGDDNNQQYKFGENSPEKKPEIIRFAIS